MLGQMMDYPLTLTHFLERARTLFPRTEVVSRTTNRSLVRTTYGELHGRSQRLASALAKLGIRPGDRVATFAWNHARHLELYMAVPAMGAVLHTLNLRLHPDELAYIASHAGDRVVFVDESLLPSFEKFAAKVTCI